MLVLEAKRKETNHYILAIHYFSTISVYVDKCTNSRQPPALTEVTWEGPLIAVTKLDMDLQSGEGRACHVTERTFYMIHWGRKRTD